MEDGSQGFTVIFRWVPVAGTPLKESLQAGIIKGIDDLIAPDGLLSEIEVGRIINAETGKEEIVCFTKDDGGGPVAVNLVVLGDMEMPAEMQEAADKAATTVKKETGPLTLTPAELQEMGISPNRLTKRGIS